MTIPDSERYPHLKSVLLDFVDKIATIQQDHPTLAIEQRLFFSFLVFPWLDLPTTILGDQRKQQEKGKIVVNQLGFDGQRAKGVLETILANDVHLKQCCPTTLQLMGYLDAHFLTSAAVAKREGATREQLEHAFTLFESSTYDQRFRRIALSHLFNFEMEGNTLTVNGTQSANDIRIERINGSAIASILGETGFQTFLHPPGIGNCFVFEEEGASALDDFQWLIEKQRKALYFAQILKYFKDGIVHLGYTTPVFLPVWAGQVRRSGVFFLGEMRRLPYEGGGKPYFVDAAAQKDFAAWWTSATNPLVVEGLVNQKGKLRQAIWRAGDYYESSHKRTDLGDRLVAIAIGFEALFSPSDKNELNFRICQSAAQFLGATPEERLRVFSDLKAMYRLRSEIVHGTYDVDKYAKGEFVKANELDMWSSHLRRALVGFLALYFNGARNADREPVLNRLAELNFDESKRAKFQEDADLINTLKRITSIPTDG